MFMQQENPPWGGFAPTGEGMGTIGDNGDRRLSRHWGGWMMKAGGAEV